MEASVVRIPGVWQENKVEQCSYKVALKVSRARIRVQYVIDEKTQPSRSGLRDPSPL